jgi:uncharacterized protein YqeY
MAMTLKHQIQTALTAAMKARNEDAKRTLRLVMSSIKLVEVEQGEEITDERILSLLQKEVKTREDTIEEAQSAKREDLVNAAKAEIQILNQFLPQQMSLDELSAIAKEIIQHLGASSIKDMGSVMKELMPKLQGRASGQDASKVVRELLQ